MCESKIIERCKDRILRKENHQILRSIPTIIAWIHHLSARAVKYLMDNPEHPGPHCWGAVKAQNIAEYPKSCQITRNSPITAPPTRPWIVWTNLGVLCWIQSTVEGLVLIWTIWGIRQIPSGGRDRCSNCGRLLKTSFAEACLFGWCNFKWRNLFAIYFQFSTVRGWTMFFFWQHGIWNCGLIDENM